MKKKSFSKLTLTTKLKTIRKDQPEGKRKMIMTIAVEDQRKLILRGITYEYEHYFEPVIILKAGKYPERSKELKELFVFYSKWSATLLCMFNITCDDIRKNGHICS